MKVTLLTMEIHIGSRTAAETNEQTKQQVIKSQGAVSSRPGGWNNTWWQ